MQSTNNTAAHSRASNDSASIHWTAKVKTLIIKGDVVFKVCPRTGKEGRLYRDCMKSADPKNYCEFYKCFGLEGCQIVITCSYDYEQYLKDMGKEANGKTS